ncbi:hypothetical protein PMZ80_008508 [Knufia obscura]|uniref:Cyclohexanone monooxygenase n=2 Tax=Knufia TaxID=430999 RepID=A0AAN8I4N9_9EURO|nr:hypothetical protein PMZ80_008508 [Knufia obscura]KAK5951964.1 hypothetical protein OHC33_006850 [Knufia fluminis]
MVAADTHYDALVIGAGFGGIYMLKRLLDQHLRVKVVDAATDVGGTWYWNTYPGAMSDTESYIYRYSWDKEDLLSYEWKEHYIKQPQALAYLHHVVDRHDLRKYMQFNTELLSAQYNEERNVWIVQTSTNETFTCHYLVTALGLLSKQNWPDIKGIKDFKGEMYHTGKWPRSYDFKGKKVGIIGNGSTGVQVITQLGKENQVEKLVSFQRHPQYSVPSGDGPVSEEYREKINRNYDEIWEQVRNSAVAFGFEESDVPCMSVTPEERRKKFQEAWDLGNGFRFMFWTFNDLTVDPAANEEACEFIRSKIRETVKDQEKARKLQPTEYYARRPLCDAGYYEQFNKENFEVVSLKDEPIEAITEKGIRTSKQEYELDVLIFATGFDAVDGNYTRLAIRGRDGESLKDHWSETGPVSYLGVSVNNFPNLMMITGPNGPFTNIPPTLETHVEFISDTIARAEKNNPRNDGTVVKGAVIESTADAEKGWTQICDELSANSLFRKSPSWIFGANIPGKKYSSLFFFGGLKDYRRRLKEVIDGGYVGFKPF